MRWPVGKIWPVTAPQASRKFISTGAAVPSLAMPGKDHPTLVSIPLVEPIVTRQMGLIKRRGKTLSPAAQQLYDLLVATRSARPRSAPAASKIQSGQ